MLLQTQDLLLVLFLIGEYVHCLSIETVIVNPASQMFVGIEHLASECNYAAA